MYLSEKEADTIRKKYGQRIANESGEIAESVSQVVRMETILDLVKIADETGNPIIQQQAANINYCVFDGQISYQYSPYSRHKTLGEAIDEQGRST